MKDTGKKLCVYCASSMGTLPIYRDMAAKLGELMVDNNWSLVYGGANCGIMGVLADSVLKKGGIVCGVAPTFFIEQEVLHYNLSEMIHVKDMSERKTKMIEMSDGFVALPGSYGTMDELFETLCLLQLKRHYKPIVLLNINGFYEPLLLQIDKMQEEGFLSPINRNLLRVVNRVEDILPRLEK